MTGQLKTNSPLAQRKPLLHRAFQVCIEHKVCSIGHFHLGRQQQIELCHEVCSTGQVYDCKAEHKLFWTSSHWV